MKQIFERVIFYFCIVLTRTTEQMLEKGVDIEHGCIKRSAVDTLHLLGETDCTYLLNILLGRISPTPPHLPAQGGGDLGWIMELGG
jgi:hypothetical protein